MLPRPAWVVLGGDFVSAVGSGLTLPFLFIYAHQVRDLSYGTAGLVVSTIALASLVGNPVGGAAADRWTPRRALMAGLVVAAAGSVALALAQTAAAAVRGGWPARLGGGRDLARPGRAPGQPGRPGRSLRGVLGSARLAERRARPGRAGRGRRGQRRSSGHLRRRLSRRRGLVPRLSARAGPPGPAGAAGQRSGVRPGSSGPVSGRCSGTRHFCGYGRSPRSS